VQELARGQLRDLLVNGRTPPIAEPLLAILDDPKRADDHVAAIRALSELRHAKKTQQMREDHARVTERLYKIMAEPDNRLTVPAWAALLKLETASMETSIDRWLKSGRITAERAEQLRRIDTQSITDEYNAK
jgi:hypothetical protein